MPDLDLVAQALARNVRQFRTERALTLDALAARAGVSRGMLIQIEQARTNPSVGTVVRVADALGVSLARLLDYDQGPVVRLVPQEEAVTLWSTPQGSAAVLLAGVESPGPLELWHWSIRPGEGHDSDAHPAGATEIVRVDAGELLLVVDGVEHSVPAGTTVTYDAARPHGYRNPGTETARLTMVVSVPLPPG
ncbi:helix-turn-helix domain-containing protein [Streptacidiphilus sp. PB12-B1b]|uniref:helix-turn-helix domain-containing protein n=1 Tax=Streptacidiphilus sp. PB12-B1b TaxID=2705012 RepID=UPI0015F9B2CA|nr:XRE family transcriptional regulator [Streptacidiphilus sp. PB12-B1b]QMU76191.1 helix-turn-helix domain-containing protein [Streptacidiphilus sp. PB12-B1b]